MFYYGETEIGNISPIIEMSFLQSNNLKMTATEMLTFIHLLPIMIGYLINNKDRKWSIITNLIEIIDIVLSSTITEEMLIH